MKTATHQTTHASTKRKHRALPVAANSSWRYRWHFKRHRLPIVMCDCGELFRCTITFCGDGRIRTNNTCQRCGSRLERTAEGKEFIIFTRRGLRVMNRIHRAAHRRDGPQWKIDRVFRMVGGPHDEQRYQNMLKSKRARLAVRRK